MSIHLHFLFGAVLQHAPVICSRERRGCNQGEIGNDAARDEGSGNGHLRGVYSSGSSASGNPTSNAEASQTGGTSTYAAAPQVSKNSFYLFQVVPVQVLGPSSCPSSCPADPFGLPSQLHPEQMSAACGPAWAEEELLLQQQVSGPVRN